MPTWLLETNARAKINLTLDILQRRADGFHDLVTVFVPIGGDVVRAGLSDTPSDTLTLEEDFPGACDGVPTDASNLLLKAVAALRERVRHIAPAHACPPLAFHLIKRIPPGGGLGGGSADGVAGLVLARRLWAAPVGDDLMAAIAAELGSDCPLFLATGVQLGTGRGERLEALPTTRGLHGVIAVPRDGVPTAQAYRGLRDEEKRAVSDVAAIRRWLAGGDGPLPELHNTFTRIACEIVPDIARLLEDLRAAGLAPVLLSGSGSACFGLAESPAAAEQACRRVQAKGWRAFAFALEASSEIRVIGR